MEKEAEPRGNKWLTQVYTLGGKTNTRIQVSWFQVQSFSTLTIHSND